MVCTALINERPTTVYVFDTLLLPRLCPGGKECPAAPALEEWRPCNDHSCMVFYWEASAWGPCIQDHAAPSSTHPNNASLSSENSSATEADTASSCAAVGVQVRKATCMKMNAGAVIGKR